MKRKIKRLVFKILPFNRRRYPRYTSCPPMKGACRYRDGNAQLECPCHIEDISKGGILITTGQTKVFPETSVELVFDVGESLAPFIVHGTVLRTYLQGIESTVYSSIEFDDPETDDVKALLEFVTSNATCGRVRKRT